MAQAGKEARLYYDPNWVDGIDVVAIQSFFPILRVMDISYAAATDEAEVSSRKSIIKMFESGMVDMRVSFQMRKLQAVTASYEYLRTAWRTQRKIVVALLDGPNMQAGIEGWLMAVYVTQFDQQWPLTDGHQTNIRFAPSVGKTETQGELYPTLITVS